MQEEEITLYQLIMEKQMLIVTFSHTQADESLEIVVIIL
jgi:hypothetical protein